MNAWYHVLMKWLLIPALLCAGLFAAGNPQLAQIRTVYLLPMGSGLDQHLATRLTELGIFEVVTDPKRADAIITDQVGASFEKKLEELYPPPPPDPEEDDQKQADSRNSSTPVTGAFGRGKGTVFLVDRKTRGVLWSIYEHPKNTSADELHHVAGKIANRLQHDLKQLQEAKGKN